MTAGIRMADNNKASDRTIPIPGYSNPKCYARALKGCCEKMTGEHTVSKAVLKRISQEFTESSDVHIKNLAFQPKDMPQSFRVGSLESKILCAFHNNSLTDLDAEALKAFDAFEAMHYAAIGEAQAPERVYSVDGDRFERWMLKTVCGGLYGGTMNADPFKVKDVEPPLDWLETLYGAPFPDGFGLYCQPPMGDERFTIGPAIVRVTPLIFDSEEQLDIQGLLLHLFGFRFRLLATGQQPRAFEAMTGHSYRPNSWVLDGSGTRVNFAWDSGRGSGEVAMRIISSGPWADHGAQGTVCGMPGPCGRRLLRYSPW
jgi:hypothetical protein